MGSLTDRDITGRYNAREFGLKGGGAGDDAAAINNAIIQASGDGGGIVEIPTVAGTVLVGSSIRLRSNVELVIQRGVTVRLIAAKDVPIVTNATGAAVTGARLTGGGILDGNRAGQDGVNNQVPLGLGVASHGIHLDGASDLLIDVQVRSCYQDGIALVGCSWVRFGPSAIATDNGRHGVLLSGSSEVTGQLLSYDNSKVESAGTGDGVHADNTTTDVALMLAAHDSASVAGDKRQGYGFREAASSGCDRNTVVGAMTGNRTGAASLVGASSIVIDPARVEIKPTIVLGSGAQIMGGTVDPSAGAGLVAPQGSIYLRTDGGTQATVFAKYGAGDTDWETVGPNANFAAPSLTLGTANAEGDATTLIRSNATILAFDTTDPEAQAFGDAAAVGVATVAARRDHKHAMPADPAAAHIAADTAVHGLPANVAPLGNRTASGEFVQHAAVAQQTLGSSDTPVYALAAGSFTYPVAFGAAPQVWITGIAENNVAWGVAYNVTSTGFSMAMYGTQAGAVVTPGYVALGS